MRLHHHYDKLVCVLFNNIAFTTKVVLQEVFLFQAATAMTNDNADTNTATKPKPQTTYEWNNDT